MMATNKERMNAMSNQGVVTPTYGRDYKTAKDAKKDWEDGKDFKFHNPTSQWNGMPCSIRDFKKTDSLELRFCKNTKLTIVKGSK